MFSKLLGRGRRGRVVLYTQPTCADCHAAKRFLAERGVEYDERDVTAGAAAEQDLRRLLNGRLMTPTLVVGKEVLTGFAANRARMEQLFPRKRS